MSQDTILPFQNETALILGKPDSSKLEVETGLFLQFGKATSITGEEGLTTGDCYIHFTITDFI